MDGYLSAPSLAQMNASLPARSGDWPSFGSCPVCESAEIRGFAQIRGIDHDRCRRCGFTFANPYPPQEVRDAFYDSDFYTNYRHLESRRRAADPYLSVSMYTDMRALAGLVAAHAPRRVLDYGCGTGAFLALLRDELGISGVEGLEISARARAAAERSYDLRTAATPADLAHSDYDFVLLLEVIEHVPAPLSFFGEVASLIAPGGLILITTPAVDNPVARYLPSRCAHYTAPSHVSLFTSASLRALLSRFSLEPVHFGTDPAGGFASSLARSALYELDFASPQHDGDLNDALYRPTAVGRLLGRRTCRSPKGPSRPLRAPLHLADRGIERVAPRPNHLYVIARKADQP